MSDSHKERLTYLVAFLAVLVGLAAFRGDIGAWPGLVLFGLHLKWLWLGYGMLAGLLLATYVGAFSFIADSFKFTAVPIVKILDVTASVFAILALGIPLIVLILWPVSAVIVWLTDVFGSVNAGALNIMLGALSGVVFGLATYAVASRLERTRRAEMLSFERTVLETKRYIEEVFGSVQTSKDSKTSLAARFAFEYDGLIEDARAYLRLKGYGIGTERELRVLAHLLQDKGIFEEGELERAYDVAELYEASADKTKLIKATRFEAALKNATGLRSKINEAIKKWLEQ